MDVSSSVTSIWSPTEPLELGSEAGKDEKMLALLLDPAKGASGALPKADATYGVVDIESGELEPLVKVDGWTCGGEMKRFEIFRDSGVLSDETLPESELLVSVDGWTWGDEVKRLAV